jgi:Arc/MetJ family transcription regulator
MKRTNVVVDRDLLNEAVAALGAKTFSEAITRSLAESVRIAKVRRLAELHGSHFWEGDLEEMRADRPAPPPRRPRKRR